MKQSSIVVEGSIKDESKKVDHSNHGDVSPPSSPSRQAQLRSRWTHNPVVLSMLACSSMQTCDEVKDVYRECLAKNDNDSMMCEAAEKYFKMCSMKNGNDNSSVLNFTPYHETA
mmetsp:Transcript_22522/g.28419  ORF Transcript_22522/g.28419 Transcript_22522/m.28419 type:complete len:114 (+) Transcript_22522:147-488(+)|eukprot:CAMPEP_0203646334 /NCGR_PEP_ID=MMETSP0088-20131115/12818_1 /ASSEMBLY_ACC=CAM_ASM_001087 /TAXON_ID=426623 /ORGANISM="Chaetoceros affinis, Strain CCMP159" /LENGTH=113 /DNA_ID=CAMNT_0050503527 /DNA_START=100 /DNA_END=441 /DNA_ORIENTATION=+